MTTNDSTPLVLSAGVGVSVERARRSDAGGMKAMASIPLRGGR